MQNKGQSLETRIENLFPKLRCTSNKLYGCWTNTVNEKLPFRYKLLKSDRDQIVISSRLRKREAFKQIR